MGSAVGGGRRLASGRTVFAWTLDPLSTLLYVLGSHQASEGRTGGSEFRLFLTAGHSGTG